MATHPVLADYSAITTTGAPSTPLADTVELFNCAYTERASSAIDIFILNHREIAILSSGSVEVTAEFARLLLLGYVSAVESFFRTIFRFIINNDQKAQADAHSLMVPYGAALYHEKKTIAEALLERYSFAGASDVKAALAKFLEGTSIRPIESAIGEYEKICQLRHCCVHRFGKLGVQNGIVLGLAQHSAALEKPLVLTKTRLDEIAFWLIGFAKQMNNFMFQAMLDRSVNDGNPYRINWAWSYARDRRKFERIYRLFETTIDFPASPPASALYERFRAVKQIRCERQGRREVPRR